VAPGGAFEFADDPETKAGVARFSRHRRYRQGGYVVRQGEPRDGFQVLRRGRVRIYFADPDGREHTVRYASPGELVAGCSGDRQQRECFSAIAETDDVETCHFSGSNLDPLLVEYPAVGGALLRLMDANLSEAYQRLHRLASTTSRQRLAELLVRLVEDEGKLSLVLPRRQLADLLGVTEETAVRSLTALTQLGLVRKEGRRVVVTDLNRLRSYASTDTC
jgi:CRP-like cAMP-binding protein